MSARQTLRRLVIIGIGGASCSGKTLLAKHIQRVLPGSPVIIHQDDFAPLEKDIPISTLHGVQDWDDPPTAILWDEFAALLRHVRETRRPPVTHQSHDHLNKQIEVGVDEAVAKKWRDHFREANVDFCLVDGFILYWSQAVVSSLDVRVLLQVTRDVLKERRQDRQTYVLQNPADAANGGIWQDPPDYFDQIVWPAYIKAHEHVADDDKIIMVYPEESDLTTAFEATCQAIDAFLES